MMQRYFVVPEAMEEAQAYICGDDAHHIRRVMRMQVGDMLMVCNGNGRTSRGTIVAFDEHGVRVALCEEVQTSTEPAVPLWVAQSMPKGDKMDVVIQKGTELGATAFYPFYSARTIVHYADTQVTKRTQRWRKIAKEAAEQAGRATIPFVHEPHSWQGIWALHAQAALTLWCDVQATQRLSSVLQSDVQAQVPTTEAPQRPLLVIIGPEGGWTEEERMTAHHAGCRLVSLGNRTLRTETAALVVLSSLLYAVGEL